MASEEDKKQNQDRKGFAGLTSMLSDVDATVDSAPKSQHREALSSSTQQSSPASRLERQEEPASNQQPHQAPEQPSDSSSTGKWLFGIAAVFGSVIWLANQSDNSSSSRSTYLPSDAARVVSSGTDDKSTLIGSTSSPTPSSTSVAPTTTKQPLTAQPQTPIRPVEAQPSIGRDNVLSTAQIRYCLAEKIRLDAAETVLNNYVDADVDRFNGYVNDYNSRCGEFRYRQGALESAQRDLEPYRSHLQAEGRSRFVRGPSAATRLQAPALAPQSVRPPPDATVQAVQRLLNDLGYDVGDADGLMGNRTRVAIIAFQRENKIPVTGAADQSLLLQMQRAAPIKNSSAGSAKSLPEPPPASANIAAPSASGSTRPPVPENSWVSGSNWYCNNGYRKVGGKCEALNIPVNAWVSGSNWYCNSGYQKVGDRCERFNVPQNAWVSGSNWYCNDGYRKVGDKCEMLNVPDNAWVSGSNWYCNDGYRKVGDHCERFNVPPNAWVSGSNWYCNDGYRKVGDKCLSVFDQQ